MRSMELDSILLMSAFWFVIFYDSILSEIIFSLLPLTQICWKHREINEEVILVFRKLNRRVTYVKI